MRVRIGKFLKEPLLRVIQKLSGSFLCDLKQEQNLFSLVNGIVSYIRRVWNACTCMRTCALTAGIMVKNSRQLHTRDHITAYMTTSNHELSNQVYFEQLVELHCQSSDDGKIQGIFEWNPQNSHREKYAQYVCHVRS